MGEKPFRGYRAEADDWGPGRSILDSDSLEALRLALEQTPLIVEHRHYRGARAPTRLVFDEYEDLEEYLRTKAWRGDHFYVWRFDHLCRDDNPLVHGKLPDVDGTVPRGGAY